MVGTGRSHGLTQCSGCKAVVVKGLVIAIVDVGPALWQGFTGAEHQIGFAELLGILQFLAGMIATDE